MRRCSRWVGVGGALLVSMAIVGTSEGAVVVAYDANAQTPAPDPVSTEGGSFTRAGFNNANITGIGPGTEMGTNYWFVVDDNPGGVNAGLFYLNNLTAADMSDPAGWYGRIRLRVPSASNTQSGTVMEIRNGTDYYGVSFVNDGTNEYIGYHNAAGGITKLADAELDAQYVTVDAVYDPATTLVNVYLDGGLIGSITAADAPATAINRFGFGSNTSGATQDVHWALAEFGTGAIPEPASLGLLGLAGLALAGRRRGHA